MTLVRAACHVCHICDGTEAASCLVHIVCSLFSRQVRLRLEAARDARVRRWLQGGVRETRQLRPHSAQRVAILLAAVAQAWYAGTLNKFRLATCTVSVHHSVVIADPL